MIHRNDIAATYEPICRHVRVTPVVEVSGADFGVPCSRLTFKLEHLQVGGSFKARGAFANLITRRVPPQGVVAASGGNHGIAVAYAAGRLGIPARIYVPGISSPAKIERIREFGADLHIVGDLYDDALAASEAWVAESGAMPVHAFDQRETLLGQGTVALELSKQAPDVTTVLVAVGGGGLIGGIASWYSGTATRVVGVEPSAAPTLTEALRAGRPVDAPAGGIAADSLAPRRIGQLVFPIASAAVDRVVLVSDDAIRGAQRTLWQTLRLAVEPGGAAALAALLSGAYVPAVDERVAVVLSGGNTSLGAPFAPTD